MRWSISLVAILLMAPLAAAQDEPTVNESDFDTSPPPEDDAYLNETESEYGVTSDDSTSEPAPADPTLNESDFDMSAPEDDQSYLDEAESEYVTSQPDDASGAPPAGGDGDAPASGGSSDTPGVAVPLVLMGALAVALLVGRRR